MASSISSPPSGFIWTAALAFCGLIVAPLLAYFAGRGQAAAQLQTALNDAFRSLMEELQGERSALIVRVLELEGENRQLRHIRDSHEHLLERHGLSLDTLVDVDKP